MKKIFISIFMLFVGATLCAQTATGPKNNVKVTFLSIFSGSTRITYERVTGSRTSAELTLGIIGLGYDWLNDADPTGVIIKAAYKYNLQEKLCADTPLKGFYLKPEVIWTGYDYNNNYEITPKGIPSREHVSRWAVLAEGGWQYIFGRFVVDIYAGIGASWGDVNADNYYHGTMMYPDAKSNIAVTSGCRLGYAF